MVQVQMANDNGLDVFDTVACLTNGLVKVVLRRVVVDLGEDVVRGCLG